MAQHCSILDTVSDFTREVGKIDGMYIQGKKTWMKKSGRFYNKYEQIYGRRLLLKMLFSMYFQQPKFGKIAIRPIFFSIYAKRYWTITEAILRNYNPSIETIYTFLPRSRVMRFYVETQYPMTRKIDYLLPDIYAFMPEKYFLFRVLCQNFYTKKVKCDKVEN